MLNKKREQKLKNQLSFAFRIRRIFLLIPLLLLCLSFVIPTQVHAQTDDSYFLNMWLNTKSLADLKNVYPGHTNIIVATISDPDLSKIPASKVSATSSNPSVLKVIDKYNIDFANYHPNMDIGIEIEAMKAGKATLTIQYKTIVKKLDITVKKSTAFIKKKKGTMLMGYHYFMRDFVTVHGKEPSIKKIKSSNKKIIKVSGQKLIPKKPGKATISAVINGKKQSIRITVKSPAPTYDQLKSKKAGLIYDSYSGKCYVKIKFTNKSQRTITKVQLKTTLFFDDAWDDTKPVKKKNVKVNIKPGKSQTVKIYFGKYPVLAPNRWKYEILQFWYR